MSERYTRIIEAYETALAGRDAKNVDILDLLPAIYDAVPDTSNDEIIAALRWLAKRDFQEADSLRRSRRLGHPHRGGG